MNEIFVEVVGVAGALGVLLAYGLNSYKKITPDSWAFVLLNFTGAGLLIVYSVAKVAWANVVINIFWVLIAVGALIRLVGKRKNT